MASRCFCFAYVPPFRPGGGAEIKIRNQPKLNHFKGDCEHETQHFD